ncbi:hypothetical protein HRD49_17555 [Corallococcus exiguus]|uniref:Uncharacterized protein n=1 Tax=Corallococcus exiguus TaxID=83462 RepID=A0A7X5BT86_9BACT|nr:hypothetical protein [Corallococcus exiguus]NRD56681.1 hypothetical protein [Corallococcus exiguus]NRD63561.1 hypothetical protein [Corallococcus exiguus]RUO89480.1 hypothetical protein D7Y11_29890 [Corallococcus sp. AB018]TNV45975.1 hypothetical protein FH620_42445 [Corallococcus exiguus]
MTLAGPPHDSPGLQAFTVLIARGVQSTVDGLSAEVRRAVLAELFRMGALACEAHSGQAACPPYTLRLDVADCRMHVELDPTRTRLSLTGLTRPRPH